MANGNPFLIKPADYSGGFQQLSQGLGALSEKRERDEQQAKQQETMSQLQAAVDTGDMNQVSAFLMKNPQLSSNIQDNIYKGMGIQEQARKDKFKTDLFSILSNPDQAEDIYAARIEEITRSGGDPSQTMSALGSHLKNPNGGLQQAEVLAATMFPEEHAQWEKVMRGEQPKPMDEYQKELVRQKDIELNIRKEENKLKALERRQKNAKTQAEIDKLQGQIEEQEEKVNKGKVADEQKINEGIYQANQNKKAVSELLNNEDYMDSLSGYTGRIPAITTTGVEAEAYLDNIKNSMTIENLSVMSGPLTDKDIQVIASASSRLREGMSKPALEKELKTISNAYDRVIKNYEKEANRKGYTTGESQGDKNGGGVVFSNEKYGDVTEADIQETMRKNNLTREQVMARLNG